MTQRGSAYCEASTTVRDDEHATYNCSLFRGHDGPHRSMHKGRCECEWTGPALQEEGVKWFRREGATWSIDVKLERHPGQRWTWPRIVEVATALLGIAQELLTDHIEGAAERHGEGPEK